MFFCLLRLREQKNDITLSLLKKYKIFYFFSCQKWKECLGFIGEHKYAKLAPDECNSRIKVCSLHFDDDCFTLSSKRLLKTAIPSKDRIKHVGKYMVFQKCLKYNKKHEFCILGEIPGSSNATTQNIDNTIPALLRKFFFSDRESDHCSRM